MSLTPFKLHVRRFAARMARGSEDGAARVEKNGNERKQIGMLAKGYLLVYNAALSLGWSMILGKTLYYALTGSVSTSVAHAVPGLIGFVELELCIFQTVAIMEVAHAMIGIVQTNIGTTMSQVYSRLFILWGVIEGFPQVCEHVGLLLLLLAWSITEAIRYAYYASSLLNSVPHFLQFLRYTLFIVLYPMGVAGEMMMVFATIVASEKTGQWCFTMPNRANMPFHYPYFLYLMVLFYIRGFPGLYMHMFKQRRKVLGAIEGSYDSENLKKDD